MSAVSLDGDKTGLTLDPGRTGDVPKAPRSETVRHSTLGAELEMRAGQHTAAARIAAVQSETAPIPCYGGNGIRGFVDSHNQVGPVLLIGRQGALCGNVQRASGPLYATEHAVVVRPSERVDIDWAFHVLRAMNLNQYSTQSAQPGLAVGNLRSLELRLPPLEEQRRIADVLDRADALRAKRRETLAGLDELTQSVFVDMFGASLRGQGPWPVGRLGDLCEFYSGGTPPKDDPAMWLEEVDWFSPRDLKSAQLVESHLRISERAAGKLRALPPGTVVVVVRGMILAHSFPVAQIVAGGCISQDLKAVVPRAEIVPAFLAASLRQQAAWLLSRAASSAHGTRKIDTRVLGEVPVVLADVTAQRVFAGRIGAIQGIKTKCEADLALLDELFASLQQRAFRGDLFSSPLLPELADAVV